MPGITKADVAIAECRAKAAAYSAAAEYAKEGLSVEDLETTLRRSARAFKDEADSRATEQAEHRARQVEARVKLEKR